MKQPYAVSRRLLPYVDTRNDMDATHSRLTPLVCNLTRLEPPRTRSTCVRDPVWLVQHGATKRSRFTLLLRYCIRTHLGMGVLIGPIISGTGAATRRSNAPDTEATTQPRSCSEAGRFR